MKNKLLLIFTACFLIAATFVLGAFSSSFTNGVGVPWLKVLANKLPKEIARDLNIDFSYPRSIQSSMFTFNTSHVFPERGIFQIAAKDEGQVFAVERNNGDLYLWDPEIGLVTKVANLFNLVSTGPTKKLLVMDLHWSFNKLYLSVVIPNEDESCESLKAFEFSLKNQSISDVYEFFKSPCMEDRSNPGMWAGRFTNSSENLYMSVGEQRFDRSGFPKNGDVIKAEILKRDSVFGKVLKFSSKLSDYEIYSAGHRNAQGLYYSIDSNRLYESEHGSLGGDEINILENGIDYGWPEVAYGRAYGWLFASGEKNPDTVPGTEFNTVLKEKYGFVRGTHPKYAKPLLSWYPSVAVGALKQVSNTSVLTEWRSSLLVATFADKGMHRIEMLNNRVVLDEQIDMGGRVRDFEITNSGMLFIAYDEGNLIYLKPKKMP
jgi:glucose/arabinose dehydrogenase